jgi:hypothetical protein
MVCLQAVCILIVSFVFVLINPSPRWHLLCALRGSLIVSFLARRRESGLGLARPPLCCRLAPLAGAAAFVSNVVVVAAIGSGRAGRSVGGHRRFHPS